MIKNLKFVVIILFILLLFFKSICSGSKPHTSTNKLPFGFSGNFIFDLPILPDHIKFRGNIQLFNFAFKGDVEIHILSRKPLKLNFSSQKIVVKTSRLIKIFKKLGILKIKKLPAIGGITVIDNFKLTVDNNKYHVAIGRIYGAKIYNRIIKINNVVFDFDSYAKFLNYKINKAFFEKNVINFLEGQYKKNFFECKFKTLKLNFSSIIDLIFKINQRVKDILIKKLEKIFPVNNIAINGTGLVKNFVIKLFSKDDFNSFNLDQLNFNLSIPNSSIVFKRNNTNTALILENKDLIFNYINKIAQITITGFNFNLKNFYCPLKISKIDFKRIFVADFKSENNLKIKFIGENNLKNIKDLTIDGSIKILPFIAEFKKNYPIKISLSPIKYSFKNNDLISNISSFFIGLEKGINVTAQNKNIFLKGNINLQNIYSSFNIKNGLQKCLLKANLSNFKINYDNIKAKIIKFFAELDVDNKNLKITKNFTDVVVYPNGKIHLELSCNFPFGSVGYDRIFHDLYLKLNINNVVYNDLTFSVVNFSKDNPNRLIAKYVFETPNLHIKGNSYFEKRTDVFFVVTRSINIKEVYKSNKPKETKSTDFFKKDIPFKIDIPEQILSFSKKYRIAVDKFVYSTKDMDYEVNNFKSDVVLRDRHSFMCSMDLYFCNFSLSGGVEFSKANLDTAFDIKAISAPIDLIIACFLRKAPVYVRGDSFIQISVMGNGTSVKKIMDNMKFEGIIRLDSGMVLKLSNLGRKVALVLELLHFVKLNPSKLKDALPFDRLVISLEGGMKSVNIKSLQLQSPIITLSSWGGYDVKRHKLTFSGVIKKGFIKKSFKLEENLLKEEKR